mmetsp:Transcript_33411/g.73061  ORF Transcript_33411/g.73061 Transcript_33411/m.73061 type:complete len:1029 (-) Transcript_33411:23-3109(-)
MATISRAALPAFWVPTQERALRPLGCRGPPFLVLVLLALAPALVAPSEIPVTVPDEKQALVARLRGDEQVVVERSGDLVPGVIVGGGRYVLAEKLCDLCYERGKANVQALPPPSERLMLDSSQTTDGQLVPYEGLAKAIARDLPLFSSQHSSAKATTFLPGVYDYSVSFLRGDPLFREDTWGYRFGQRLGKGNFGEVWRAVSLEGSMGEVVLKRLFVKRGEHVRRSGEREIFFGTVLQHRPHIARFIESFERAPSDGALEPGGRPLMELWLVFHNEGFSLTQHLFQMRPGSPVMELSKFWWHMKQQPLGEQIIKNFAYQLLHAIAVAHNHNITHRDIKLGNVLVTDTWPPVVRLGDWGSALAPLEPEVVRLYMPDGPTEDDETSEYQPPEVTFDEELLARVGVRRAGAWRDVSYDIWSYGVLLLELILGTQNVFEVDGKQWLRIEHSLRRAHVPEARFEQARLLQGMLELCIVPPGVPRDVPLTAYFEPAGSPLHTPLEPALFSESEYDIPGCSDSEFAAALMKHDAAGLGFSNRAGRDFLRRLLRWSPNDRISAREALAHEWFDDGAELPPPRPRAQPTSQPSQAGPVVARSEEEFLPVVTQSAALGATCPSLRLHAAVHADIGRRRYMEDRYALQNVSGGECCGSETGFIGVFDGHNGRAVAQLLRQSLHHRLATALALPGNISEALQSALAAVDLEVAEDRAVASDQDDAPGSDPTADGGTRPLPGDAGSTALVGLVSGCSLHLANVGDCRAVGAQWGWGVDRFGRSLSEDRASFETWPPGALVEVTKAASEELRGQRGTIVEIRSSTSRRLYVIRLLRDGALRPFRHESLRLLSKLRATRLTEDHKPASERERRRIEALGGAVDLPAVSGNMARVAGLATSRALGSFASRPLVSAEPDLIEYTLRPDRDAFVVLASDGVWDVLDDQMVIDLVWDQLESVHDWRRGPAAALEGAAQLVVQTALERGSLDNLTCMVVLLSWTDGAVHHGATASGNHNIGLVDGCNADTDSSREHGECAAASRTKGR